MNTETNALAAKTICFIGAGNMASAIIGGLIQRGVEASTIIAAEPSLERLESLSADLGVRTTTENSEAVAEADVVVLSVKPQILKSVCEALAPSLSPEQLVISIAAGIEMATLEAWLGANIPVVRVMPNTPAQVLQGASGLYANALVSAEQKTLVGALFTAIGVAEWLDNEGLMHSVTALSGSGPAYIFLVIDAMEKAAVAQGIEANTARTLAAQTVLGAAQMVLDNGDISPEQLKRNVMSPGGTTERAIEVLEQQGLPAIFAQAMDAANQRSVELAELLKAD